MRTALDKLQFGVDIIKEVCRLLQIDESKLEWEGDDKYISVRASRLPERPIYREIGKNYNHIFQLAPNFGKFYYRCLNFSVKRSEFIEKSVMNGFTPYFAPREQYFSWGFDNDGEEWYVYDGWNEENHYRSELTPAQIAEIIVGRMAIDEENFLHLDKIMKKMKHIMITGAEGLDLR